jgi:hypothetical protein
MKFTTLLTKSAMAIALILGMNASQSVAGEATVCSKKFKKPTNLKVAIPAEQLKCISDNTAMNTNIIFTKSFAAEMCSSKKGYSWGHTWDAKTKVAAANKAKCQAIGKVIDCYNALEACAGDDACSNKTKSKECKAPGLDIIVYPAPTAEAPAAEVAAVEVAAAAPAAEEAPAD